ncbi:MAG TPA: MCP four helix bundle domain-containing protein, partial [Aminobacteriaceae bacterium]|nr:MCP four helix bundle domain-containing protein [Aminobacteriaceae bacterium]
MNVFANMKTKGKILALVLVMALLLGAVGYTGYYFNAQSAENLSEVYEENLLPITWLFDALVQGQGIQSDVAQILLAHDAESREELEADIVRRVAIVDEHYARYGKLPLDAFEKEHFELALKALADYRVAWRKSKDLAAADRGYEAYQTFTTEVNPLFTAYQAEIRSLAEYAQKRADETNASIIPTHTIV